ncbi:MAG: hypothetical protein WC942_06775 [Clostridia bacterium]|jgi:hypothetical protein
MKPLPYITGIRSQRRNPDGENYAATVANIRYNQPFAININGDTSVMKNSNVIDVFTAKEISQDMLYYLGYVDFDEFYKALRRKISSASFDTSICIITTEEP